jgi:hypothetical protein
VISEREATESAREEVAKIARAQEKGKSTRPGLGGDSASRMPHGRRREGRSRTKRRGTVALAEIYEARTAPAPNAILATNTSSLGITELARAAAPASSVHFSIRSIACD